MTNKIFYLKGTANKPVSIILAGVHGDEKCGIEAFKKIVPNLKIQKGTVLFGFGNPKAIRKNKRFIETNLNRMFKNDNLLSKKDKLSYEYKRAQYLKKYLEKSDALLDIHASFTPKSLPFTICERNAFTIATFLPANLIVSGFDKIQPGGTDFYMNSIGKKGICVECGYYKNRQALKIAQKSIINFLKARGHIKSKLHPVKKSFIKITELYTTKTDNFTLTKKFADFEQIKKGQIIGIDGKREICAKKNGIILFARDMDGKNSEAFLFGKNFKDVNTKT